MIRKYLLKLEQSEKERIKWRSHEVTRIEAFSDAVFAFAVSLLIISLEVPKSSKELLESMSGFFPFVFCFGTLFMIWYWQYKFFRRYGLHDYTTLVLNGALITVVLFYVYPLKFMFTAWFLGTCTIRDEDNLPLALLYNFGFMVIYLLFGLMYYNAFLKRQYLALTPPEIYETRTFMYTNLLISAIGLLIGVVAIFLNSLDPKATWGCFAGYALIGLVDKFLNKTREKVYHKKFGNIPIEEPHLAEE